MWSSSGFVPLPEGTLSYFSSTPGRLLEVERTNTSVSGPVGAASPSYLQDKISWQWELARLFSPNKLRSARSLTRAARKRGGSEIVTGFGGHFRTVQGFKYVGSREE